MAGMYIIHILPYNDNTVMCIIHNLPYNDITVKCIIHNLPCYHKQATLVLRNFCRDVGYRGYSFFRNEYAIYFNE